jgi:Flagellar hook-length control protein FliK
VPTLPILPGLPGLPGPIQSGLVQANPGQPDGSTAADPTSPPSFVDQLAAALALLVPSQTASTSPGEPTLPEDAASDPEAEPAPAAGDDKDSQPGAQDIADLLASFGLVPLPILTPASLLVPHTTQAPGAGDDAATAALPTQPLALPVPPGQARPVLESPGVDSPALAGTDLTGTSATVTSPGSGADVADAAEMATAPPAATPEPAPAPLNLLTMPAEVRLRHPDEPARVALPDTARPPTPPNTAATTPVAVPATRGESRHAETRPEREVHSASSIQAASDVRPARVPDAVHPRLTAVGPGPVQAPAGPSQHGSQPESGDAPHDQQPPALAPDTDTADPPTSATPVLAPAVNTGSATAEAARPGDVVAQIAHQAELYRLPGGRGVRIQLRPEGLGGVEVTVRYGTMGALELHVNVEHAATGVLVQAGWTELREALSQHGISPDRLVMSLSGPDGGSLSSDSGSFGSGSGSGASFRSDAGPTGFGQSPSHGQQAREQAPARPHWTPPVESPAAQEAESVAPLSSSTSRIDLRA